MNPFDETAHADCAFLCNGNYNARNKYDIDAQTRARIILANAVINDGLAFSHSLSRCAFDRAIFKELSIMRDGENKTRQSLSFLIPKDESVVERAIFCEQLEIELAAELSSRKIQKRAKTLFNSILIDDLDHLYRFSNLLDLTDGIPAEKLIHTAITPTRPTAAQLKPFSKSAYSPIHSGDITTTLAVMTMTAVKRHISGLYATTASLPHDDLSRGLLAEISNAEDYHLTRCEGLLPQRSTFERVLLYAYCECYTLWSCIETETDSGVKNAFEQAFAVSVNNLKRAAELLQKYEGKHYDDVIAPCEFPPPISLTERNDYIHLVIKSTDLSAYNGDELQDRSAPSNEVIQKHIDRYGNRYISNKKPS